MIYFVSVIDENYVMGLLYVDLDSDFMDFVSWIKLQEFVFLINEFKEMFGLGYNSFIVDQDGNDVLVYYCCQYIEIEGDLLWNLDCYMFVKYLKWDENGMLVFGKFGQL